MLSQVLFAAALLFSIACASPVTENRLIGGQEARPGQFPHQISLHSIVFYHWCGGSILSNRFALTAAHCVYKGLRKVFVVVVGAHKKNSKEDGLRHEIDRFIWHEKYNRSSSKYDVGLIEVATPIVFNERVAPISVYKEYIGAGIEAVTCGWGQSYPSVIYKNLLD